MPQQKPRYRKSKRSSGAKVNLPDLNVQIDMIGHQGDGIAVSHETGRDIKLYIPNAAVGDQVTVSPVKKQGDGYLAPIKTIHTPSPDRKAPDCGASPACGGCQFQHLDEQAYKSWKTNMVKDSIAKASLRPQEYKDPFFAKPNQRRRARIAYRRLHDHVVCGFRASQSHRIIHPDGCVILRPEIKSIITALEDDILMHLSPGEAGEAEITLCDHGLDITLRPQESLNAKTITALTTSISDHPIMRLSMVEPHGQAGGQVTMLIAPKTPVISWEHNGGVIKTIPAPAGFMQADGDAEHLMQSDILDTLSGSHRVIDLFSGCGTLSLPLLTAEAPPKLIEGFDHGSASLDAMTHAAKQAGFHHQIKTAARNLFNDPVMSSELKGYDAAIIDPPRAGAKAQIEQLAESDIPRIMMVSCNPTSFVRDATLLTECDYRFKWVRMIDQFRLTSHVELVAYFELSS